jgi:hypothetical protein
VLQTDVVNTARVSLKYLKTMYTVLYKLLCIILLITYSYSLLLLMTCPYLITVVDDLSVSLLLFMALISINFGH